MYDIAKADYSAHLLSVEGMIIVTYEVCVSSTILVGEVSDEMVEGWIEAERQLVIADELVKPTSMPQVIARL